MLQGTPCDIEISSTIYSGKICSVHMYNTFILEFQINTMSRIKNNLKVPKYSRLRNKHRGTLIKFWTFIQGLRFLLERVMYIFFSKYPLFYGMGMAFLPDVPGATFIPGAASIPESRIFKSSFYSRVCYDGTSAIFH